MAEGGGRGEHDRLLASPGGSRPLWRAQTSPVARGGSWQQPFPHRAPHKGASIPGSEHLSLAAWLHCPLPTPGLPRLA